MERRQPCYMAWSTATRSDPPSHRVQRQGVVHRGGCGQCPPEVMVGIHVSELGDAIIEALHADTFVAWLDRQLRRLDR